MSRKKLDRRRFLQAGGAGLTGLTLLPGLSLTARAQASATSERRVYALNPGWLFNDKVVPNATQAVFNDAGFKRVTIPHTNKLLPWHGFDDKEYEFVSIYRKHFRLPPDLNGRRVFVDFGGVMTASRVWINGEKLGEYRGGYTPFSFELTPYVNWKGDNVLAVEVDSTERADIPPFGGEIDYLTFGGIYRDVALRVVPRTFIDNVFARPVEVLGEKRMVKVRVLLDLRESPGSPLKLIAELRDGPRVIASQSEAVGREMRHELTLASLGAIE